MNKYIVYIPAYEMTIEAKDEIDALEKAIQEISYEDLEARLIIKE